MYGITRLDNGIRVVTYNMPKASSAAIGVWVGVGSRYENSLVSGISHFIEHLLFKGTKKRSAGEIKKSIEGMGGSLNGFTGDEVTCYLCKVLAKDLRLGLDVLADMVSDPLIKENDIERERRVICEEIKMYFDLPNYHVNELLNESKKRCPRGQFIGKMNPVAPGRTQLAGLLAKIGVLEDSLEAEGST